MATDRDGGQPQGYSRRSFLAKLALGLAGVAGAGFLLRHTLLTREKGHGHPSSDLPGPDSIFHPRRDVLERHRKA